MNKLLIFLILCMFDEVVFSQNKIDQSILNLIFSKENICYITDTLNVNYISCNDVYCKPNYDHINFEKNIKSVVTFYVPSASDSLAKFNSIPLIEDYTFSNKNSSKKVFENFKSFFNNFKLQDITEISLFIYEVQIVVLYNNKLRIIHLSDNEIKKAKSIVRKLKKDKNVINILISEFKLESNRFYKSY